MVTKIPEDGNGWSEWKNKVLSDLKEVKDTQAEMKADLVEIKVAQAVTRTTLDNKAKLWGTLSGFFGTIGAILLLLVTKLI